MKRARDKVGLPCCFAIEGRGRLTTKYGSLYVLRMRGVLVWRTRTGSLAVWDEWSDPGFKECVASHNEIPQWEKRVRSGRGLPPHCLVHDPVDLCDGKLAYCIDTALRLG